MEIYFLFHFHGFTRMNTDLRSHPVVFRSGSCQFGIPTAFMRLSSESVPSVLIRGKECPPCLSVSVVNKISRQTRWRRIQKIQECDFLFCRQK